MRNPSNLRLSLDKEFNISRHSDRDDIDSAVAYITRALQEASYSDKPVKFEIWKQDAPATDGQFQLPFMPAEAALGPHS